MNPLRAISTQMPRALAIAGSQAGSGVMRIPVTTTAGTFAIPSAFAGKYVTVYTEGGIYVELLAGIAGTVVTLGTQSAVDGTTKAVTINAVSGARINDGQRVPYIMPNADIATHISWDASGTGSLTIELAE